MKTTLLLLLLVLHRPHKPVLTNTSPVMVYVCKGAKGKKYHLRADCRGLSSCQHRIMKMRLADAQKQGLTLCGWEK